MRGKRGMTVTIILQDGERITVRNQPVTYNHADRTATVGKDTQLVGIRELYFSN
jgi:hypothetical protein